MNTVSIPVFSSADQLFILSKPIQNENEYSIDFRSVKRRSAVPVLSVTSGRCGENASVGCIPQALSQPLNAFA